MSDDVPCLPDLAERWRRRPSCRGPEGAYPNKTVRYINPFPAGGATDTLSRIFCAKMSELTGQQWIVENHGGSGGNVGIDALAQSPADGYTLGLGGIASHAIAPTLYAKLPFNPATTSPSSRRSGGCPTCWSSISTCRPRPSPS